MCTVVQYVQLTGDAAAERAPQSVVQDAAAARRPQQARQRQQQQRRREQRQQRQPERGRVGEPPPVAVVLAAARLLVRVRPARLLVRVRPANSVRAHREYISRKGQDTLRVQYCVTTGAAQYSTVACVSNKGKIYKIELNIFIKIRKTQILTCIFSFRIYISQVKVRNN